MRSSCFFPAYRGSVVTAALLLFAGLAEVPHADAAVGNDVFNAAQFGAIGDGVTDSTLALQAAIDAVPATGGTVFVPAGTYIINGTLQLRSHLKLAGEGQATTVLKKQMAGNLMTAIGKVQRSDITIADLTLDVAHSEAATGILMEYVSNVLIERCTIANVTMWGVSIGVLDGTDPAIRNRQITIRDSTFDGLDATYEHLLVFNSANVTVRRSTFRNGALGNGIGIYQLARRIFIDQSTFESMRTGVYYSLSTDHIRISNSTFRDNVNGVNGANQSDNGAFDRTFVKRVAVRGSVFERNNLALRLGAVVGGRVEDCTFSRNGENALVVSQGQSPVDHPSERITVVRSSFVENNQVRTASILHPGLLVTGFSGKLQLTVRDCSFGDEQGEPSQLYPISFVGPGPWSKVLLKRSTLSAYGGAYSVGLADGASFDGKFSVVNCTDISGPLPTP